MDMAAQLTFPGRGSRKGRSATATCRMDRRAAFDRGYRRQQRRPGLIRTTSQADVFRAVSSGLMESLRPRRANSWSLSSISSRTLEIPVGSPVGQVRHRSR